MKLYRRTAREPAKEPDKERELAWLVRDDRVLASLEVPVGAKAKAKGLLGRDRFDAAMLITRCRSVHTVTLGFELDVAFLDRDMTVIRTMRLGRNRVTLPVWRARSVIEAEAGAFGRWDLKVGDVLEVQPVSGDSGACDSDVGDSDVGDSDVGDSDAG